MEVTIAESAIYRLSVALEPHLRKRSCLELATDAEEEVFLQAGVLHGLDTGGGEVRYIAPTPENAGLIASYESIVDHIIAEMMHRAQQARLGGISHSVEQRWWERVDDTAAKRGARAGGGAGGTSSGADSSSLMQSRVITARDFVANYAPPDGWATVAGPGAASGLPAESKRAILKAAYGIEGIRSAGGGKGMNIDATAAMAPVLRTGSFGKRGRVSGARSSTAVGAPTSKSRPHKRKAPVLPSRSAEDWQDDSTLGSRLTRGGMALSQQLHHYASAAHESSSQYSREASVAEPAGWPEPQAPGNVAPAPKLKLKLKRRSGAEEDSVIGHGVAAPSAHRDAGLLNPAATHAAVGPAGDDWRQQLATSDALFNSSGGPAFDGEEDLFDVANLPTGDDETLGMTEDML